MRWPTGDVLFGRVRLFGDNLVSKSWGLRELSMVDGFMAGLVEAEKQKGSGMTTGILEAGSTEAQTLPMVPNRVLTEILIPN